LLAAWAAFAFSGFVASDATTIGFSTDAGAGDVAALAAGAGELAALAAGTRAGVSRAAARAAAAKLPTWQDSAKIVAWTLETLA